MLVTEAEAKATKNCKWLRLRAGPDYGTSAGYNRTVLHWKRDLKERWVRWWLPGWWDHTRGRFFRCEGSSCMAWRWAADRKHGYCGHAGEPGSHSPVSQFEERSKFGLFEQCLYMLIVSFIAGIGTFLFMTIRLSL